MSDDATAMESTETPTDEGSNGKLIPPWETGQASEGTDANPPATDSDVSDLPDPVLNPMEYAIAMQARIDAEVAAERAAEATADEGSTADDAQNDATEGAEDDNAEDADLTARLEAVTAELESARALLEVREAALYAMRDHDVPPRLLAMCATTDAVRDLCSAWDSEVGKLNRVPVGTATGSTRIVRGGDIEPPKSNRDIFADAIRNLVPHRPGDYVDYNDY